MRLCFVFSDHVLEGLLFESFLFEEVILAQRDFFLTIDHFLAHIALAIGV